MKLLSRDIITGLRQSFARTANSFFKSGITSNDDTFTRNELPARTNTGEDHVNSVNKSRRFDITACALNEIYQPFNCVVDLIPFRILHDAPNLISDIGNFTPIINVWD